MKKLLLLAFAVLFAYLANAQPNITAAEYFFNTDPGPGFGTSMPVTAGTQTPGGNAPHLEYEVYTYDTGKIVLKTYLSPTLNFHNDDGLKYAISIDDEQPQTITINKDDNNIRIWEGWMANNIINKTSTHHIATTGKHTIKYWMVSPAVVVQKIVGDMGGLKESYLGPPETRYTNSR